MCCELKDFLGELVKLTRRVTLLDNIPAMRWCNTVLVPASIVKQHLWINVCNVRFMSLYMLTMNIMRDRRDAAHYNEQSV